MRSFRYMGWWWTPEAEGNRVPGTLTYSDKLGLRLETIGHLPTTPSLYTALLPTVVGLTKEGLQVTLQGVAEAGKFTSTSGSGSHLFMCERAYVGYRHLSVDPALRVFDFFEVSFTHLLTWLGEPTFFVRPPRSSRRDPTFRIETTAPRGFRLNIPGGRVSADISFKVFSGRSKGEVAPRARVIIEPESPLTYDDVYRQYISPLQDLLSLATGETNAIEALG